MKILITGGTGFIGRHLVEYWKGSVHQINILARTIDQKLFPENTGCIEADITNEEDVQAAIIYLQPDIVIHSAAMSKPNDCALNKEQCYQTNVAATAFIVEACKAINAKLIFLSTDFVFGHDGSYAEDDNYAPVNYYGESKMIAEKAIIASGLAYAIVRTVLVIGEKLEGQSNTFLHWVKENLEAKKEMRIYTDQLRNVTYVSDLCKGINAIIETGFTGKVHLAGNEIFTPFSLAKQVADYFGYNSEFIHPITSQQQPEAAMRPRNSVLKIDKALRESNYTTTPLQEVLQQVFPVQ